MYENVYGNKEGNNAGEYLDVDPATGDVMVFVDSDTLGGAFGFLKLTPTHPLPTNPPATTTVLPPATTTLPPATTTLPPVTTTKSPTSSPSTTVGPTTATTESDYYGSEENGSQENGSQEDGDEDYEE